MKKYKEEGLKGLLEMKKAPGKKPLIEGEALESLKERLKNLEGFKSYGEIQEWVQKKWQISMAYKSIYQLVRYQL